MVTISLILSERDLKITCAILICRSSAIARYHAFTPNLPEATCLMADLVLLSLPLTGSSPPSPVLLLPPILMEEESKVLSTCYFILYIFFLIGRIFPCSWSTEEYKYRNKRVIVGKIHCKKTKTKQDRTKKKKQDKTKLNKTKEVQIWVHNGRLIYLFINRSPFLWGSKESEVCYTLREIRSACTYRDSSSNKNGYYEKASIAFNTY